MENQFSFIDMTDPKPAGRKARRRSVDRTMSRIRELHEELNRALYTHATERPLVQSPESAFHVIQPFLDGLDHEELWVIVMDTRKRIQNLVKLYQGTVNCSNTRIAEIFRQAIIDNAPAIIIAHNHPSGDPSPSPDDIAVTREIVLAGSNLDVQVLDHIIVAGGKFVSLKERGLGFNT
jgi:DNA repair protein RadC